MLAGLETPDYGSISGFKGITTGYLPQDGLALSGGTVLEECLSVFGDLREIEKQMEALTHRMAELDPHSDEYHQVTERYHRLKLNSSTATVIRWTPRPPPCSMVWVLRATT